MPLQGSRTEPTHQGIWAPEMGRGDQHASREKPLKNERGGEGFTFTPPVHGKQWTRGLKRPQADIHRVRHGIMVGNGEG